MTDPRLVVGFEGLHMQTLSAIAGTGITYDATQAGGSAVVGRAVTFSDDAGEITLAADGEGVLGKLLAVESDGVCLVQYHGFMTLPGGTGATLTRMNKIVGDLLVAAEGYIRVVNTAVAAELGVARGLIADSATTTAVIVYL